MDDVAREFVTKARQAIAENVKQPEIFKRIRSYALYHYVAALEGRAVRASLEESLGAGYAEHRVAVETSAKVLRAAYAHCPEDDETPVRFSLHAYKEAEALIEYVAKLDTIEYAFELSEKAHFHIDVDTRNSRIKFQYADSKADKADPLQVACEVSDDRVRSFRKWCCRWRLDRPFGVLTPSPRPET